MDETTTGAIKRIIEEVEEKRKSECPMKDCIVNHMIGGNDIDLVKSWLKQIGEHYKITSVNRDDLEEAGFDTKNISEETMKRLASKMADSYVENSFWIDLPIHAEYLEIPKKKEE